MKFTDYIKNFDFSVSELIVNIMESLSEDIIELNQIEQLQEGIDAYGKKIKTLKAKQGDVYAPYTIAIRASNNLPTNIVDLKDTGQFYKTFKVEKKEKGFEVIADFDVHETNILDNFSDDFDFLGLTKDNTEFLADFYIFPELEKRIKNKLNI